MSDIQPDPYIDAMAAEHLQEWEGEESCADPGCPVHGQDQAMMLRLRAGRHQDRNLYIQAGDEPSDDDEFIGIIFDPARAALLIGIVNGERPPRADAAQ